MGQLLCTTAAFRIFDVPRPGVPFLVDGKMKINEPPSEWLLDLASQGGGGRYSLDTLRTYAEALDDFFEVLEGSGWRWDELTRDDVDEYIARLRNDTSPHTKRHLQVSTINLRVGVISQFYDWAVERKKISTSPIFYKRVRQGWNRRGMLGHLSAGETARRNSHLLRQEEREPTALGMDIVRRIVGVLSPRDRLICEAALTSGARRMEIAALNVEDWSPIRTTASAVAIRPRKAKRGNRAPLYFPKPVYERVCRYIAEERPVILRRRGNETSSLFLTRNGGRIPAKTITQIFYRASRRAGCRATFHELRHTFATRIAAVLVEAQRKDNSRMNTGLILKVLMRHKSILTTFRYIHSVQNDPEILAYAVQECYERWL